MRDVGRKGKKEMIAARTRTKDRQPCNRPRIFCATNQIDGLAARPSFVRLFASAGLMVSIWLYEGKSVTGLSTAVVASAAPWRSPPRGYVLFVR